MRQKSNVMDVLIASFLFLIVGGLLLFHWNSFQDWRLWQKIDVQGLPARAVIQDLDLTGSASTITSCRVQIEYFWNNRRYSQKLTADSAFCVNHILGDEVTVGVLPARPQQVSLGIASKTPIHMQIFLLILVDGAIVLSFAGYWLNQRLTRQSQLKNTQLLNQVEERGLPITVYRPKGDVVMDWGCILPFGLVVTAGLFVAIGLFFQQAFEQGWGLAVVGVCSSLPFLGFGLFLLYLFFRDTAVSYTFSPSELLITYRMGHKVIPIEHVVAIELAFQQTRGVVHHYLKLTLQENQTIDINVPRENFEQLTQLIRENYPNHSTHELKFP